MTSPLPPESESAGHVLPAPIPDDHPSRTYTLAQVMPTRRRRGPIWLFVVLAAVAAAALAAGGFVLLRGLGESGRAAHAPAANPTFGPTLVTAAVPDTFTLSGHLTLTSSRGISVNNASCRGANGYDDIQPGAQITVTNEKGTVIGVGSLGYGSMVGGSCVFDFSVPGVPGGQRFYGVTLGHRGTIQYSEHDARLTVELELGHD